MLHHFITHSGQFLFIPILNDAHNIVIKTDTIEWIDKITKIKHLKVLPSKENWEMFCNTKTITEKQWEEIVEKIKRFESKVFTCYTPKWRYSKYRGAYCKTATGAGLSLLESRGLHNNKCIILKMK